MGTLAKGFQSARASGSPCGGCVDNTGVHIMIKDIREKIASGLFEYSKHAADRSILRHITIQELREAVAGAEIIEDYPDDKYGPSCLVPGFTRQGRPLHIQCSYPSRPLIRIVTIYEPDPDEWIDWKARRK